MGRDRHLATVILLGLCLGSATVKAAEYYRWVDEDGTVHFTETPPPGLESEKVSVSGKSPAAPAPPAAAEPVTNTAPAAPGQDPTAEPLSRAEQERQQRAEQRALKRAEAEQLAANCKAMQEQYDNFVPNKGIIVQEADGSTRRLTSDERLAKVEEAENYLKQHCSD